MRVLLIAAHGSRRVAANTEIIQLASALAPLVVDRYQRVQAAFLELAEPSIAQAIDISVAAGAGEIMVLPYFLASGRHVAEDIPAIIQDRRLAHPDVDLRLAEHLGARPELLALLAELV